MIEFCTLLQMLGVSWWEMQTWSDQGIWDNILSVSFLNAIIIKIIIKFCYSYTMQVLCLWLIC